jgi:thermostable 8-oxoguanine DNA glycosylase
MMRHHLTIADSDISRLHNFLQNWSSDPLVIERKRRNLAEQKREVTRKHFWNVMLACLLTSRQRSGPNDPVSKLLMLDPFPLAIDRCENCDLATYAKDVLQKFGGIRFTTKIPEQLIQNLPLVTGDGWQKCNEQMERLRKDQTVTTERAVADFIDDTFWGFGPKQSRNLLQIFGLTRYEIPIDSRVVKWMTDFGFSMPLSSDLLQNRSYYLFVEDAVHELCRAADVFPCVLDAAVFASFDEGGWTNENAVW